MKKKNEEIEIESYSPKEEEEKDFGFLRILDQRKIDQLYDFSFQSFAL